jgi:hypothetical protein
LVIHALLTLIIPFAGAEVVFVLLTCAMGAVARHKPKIIQIFFIVLFL